MAATATCVYPGLVVSIRAAALRHGCSSLLDRIAERASHESRHRSSSASWTRHACAPVTSEISVNCWHQQHVLARSV